MGRKISPGGGSLIYSNSLYIYCSTIHTFFSLLMDIRYLEGGIESGFKKVDRDAYVKKLLHVKGKRNVRVQQVSLACLAAYACIADISSSLQAFFRK